jgi:dipeptidyl aminopeptidase/acylaminoacyl peptidase
LNTFTKRAAACAALIILSVPLVTSAADSATVSTTDSTKKRNISEHDLFRFQWIADPQVAPSGKHVVFAVAKVDDKRADYETSLYRVSTTGNDTHRLTTGKRDSSPRWSPDGKYLAFLRSVEADGKPQPPQLFVLAMEGGEPRQLTRQPMGVSQPAWSPDGKSIAFLSNANEQDLATAACEENKAKTREAAPAAPGAADPCKPIRDTDVRVVTRAAYRANGLGYLDFGRPSHIWSIAFSGEPTDAAPAAARQLTRGEFSEGGIAWATDGSRIYFVTERDLEPYYKLPSTSIYAVPASGGDAQEVTRFAGRLNAISVSPQGDQLAFLGTLSEPVQSHTRTNLWVLNLKAAGPAKNLTAKYDWDIGSGIIGDMGAPRAGGESRPIWNAAGDALTVVVAKEGRANLERFEVSTGRITPITKGDQAVVQYGAGGGVLVAGISNALELNELYLVQADNKVRLTTLNDKQFAGLNLTAPQDIWYRSFDGRKIHALVQLPPDFDAKKKYPLILNIHGGPHAAYGYTFFHEMQWMAARGYVVLYPNPRGSTTYGEAFANVIQYRYPGDDYLDLMAGVDELIKRGWVDEKRMAVTGGSGGGLLTNWAIGHTNRFAAAVSQRDISDWSAWWYTADFTLFQATWFKKPPFEDATQYRERSPMTFINNVKTPTMFILGDVDSRTPAESGGDQMFRALKYKKIPTVMVRFPGESHDLSRSGKPWHRVERLQHIVNWFDIYLQGKKANDYAIAPPAVPDLRAVPVTMGE